ncbi:MAG TPA: pantetheine-phosphate adenylyltransferase [Candidatus Scybalomonas excrementigallinarum]|nr:pantetheine-phosphate adenylyltransferase [Candidatus Scybalomonas excrementigallinarum]
MKIALYPGSFDPITLGHLDVVKRAASVFDRLVIGVLNNKAKSPLFSVEERVKILEEVTQELPNVSIGSFSGLTVDYASQIGATVIVRGLRAITDFEFELQLSQTNRKLNPNVDTMFFTTSEEYAYLSSTSVKEIALFGGAFEQFVPERVIPYMREKYKKN